MRQRWLRLAGRVDALSQRERVLVFAAVLVVLGFAGHFLVLGPMAKKQAMLSNQIAQQRASLAETEEAIGRKLADAQTDPDFAQRKQLQTLRADTARMSEQMRAMQSGLVPPDRMAPLLEAILRANGRLKLVSMQTLTVDSLNEMGKPGASTDPSAPVAVESRRPAAKQADLLFRHGVEITVRGSYLDMVDYMAALEALPTQLFWGKAQLQVEQYPSVRLTLTLYTLSMDPKWIKL